MANELCAYNFGNNIDGIYQETSPDHWSHLNGNYFIYKDSNYWMICSSNYLYWSLETMPNYSPTDLSKYFLKARKAYTAGDGANGHYLGIDGNPDGDIKLGAC